MMADTLHRPPDPAQTPAGAVDWALYRRNWFDDGNDCVSSSFAEALRLTYGDGTPDVPELEAAYRQWHPEWDDNNATMRLDWYWQALQSIGVHVESLPQRDDLVTEIRAELDASRFPTAWIYLWSSFERVWFHHAVVVVGWSGNTLAFWDPQRGFGWEYDADLFRQTGLDGATSGYAYSAVWQGAAQQPEEPMPIQRVARVLTADTQRDISSLINVAAAEHGFDPVGFLAGLIGESNLHEHAVRENNPLDWSYGLSQPNMPYLHPDCGLPLARGERGIVLHTPENIRLFREWAFDAGQLLPYTTRRYAELIQRFQTGGDPLLTWTRWNAPNRSLAENEVAQPHVLRNYRNGLAEAQQYRAATQEEPTMPTVQQPPGIVWLPSPNVTSGRGGQKPRAIVNHVAEGSLAGVDNWFGQTASQVSAHFCVGKAGQIHQYVSSRDTAWANGRVNGYNRAIPWLHDAYQSGVNPNALTISIEREGFATEPLTEPMYQAVLALHRYLCDYWGIPADAVHIVGHRDIDSVSRANCPGPHFPWARLLADLNAREEPAMDNDTLYRDIGASAREIIAAATEIVRLSRPGSEGGDLTISDSEAVGGVISAAAIIDRHRFVIVDKAGQVAV